MIVKSIPTHPRALISARIDGEVSAGESIFLDRHLEECAACRREESGLLVAAAVLRELPAHEPPPGALERLIVALREAQVPKAATATPPAETATPPAETATLPAETATPPSQAPQAIHGGRKLVGSLSAGGSQTPLAQRLFRIGAGARVSRTGETDASRDPRNTSPARSHKLAATVQAIPNRFAITVVLPMRARSYLGIAAAGLAAVAVCAWFLVVPADPRAEPPLSAGRARTDPLPRWMPARNAIASRTEIPPSASSPIVEPPVAESHASPPAAEPSPIVEPPVAKSRTLRPALTSPSTVKPPVARREPERGWVPRPLSFQGDDTLLSRTARQRVEELARHLRAHPEIRLAIRGHTDVRASLATTLWMGQIRAGKIAAYLQDLGIDESRMRVDSVSTNRPLKFDRRGHRRPCSDRVEFVLKGEVANRRKGRR